MPETILGLDIGTNSTKAALFDLSGAELITAEADYSLSTPQPGWVEQAPEDVWQAVISLLGRVVAQAGPERRILALALAAQSGSVIPAKADGRPVYPMITWLDSRTEALVKEWQAEGVEEKVRRLSGWLLHPGLPLPNIAWLRRFRPDVFAQAERFLGVLDFLNHRLTGQFCADLSSATEMQLVDVASGQWSQPLGDLAGLTPGHLARLAPAGSVVGPLRAEVSRLTGLPAETLVVNGGHDQCCAALGMGMISPGKVMLASGTAWVLTGLVESPSVENIPAHMDLNFHVVPQRWTISQLLGGFGATVEWWLNQAWQNVDPGAPLSRSERYAFFDEALKESEPGCKGLLFLPLSGSAQLAQAKPRGGLVGLRLDHSRADMGRAVLEGAAYEVRWALEVMRQSGIPVEHLWLAGGATRSPIWPQILADITGLPFFVTDYAHWPALGAAILAGVGAGVFETLEAGIARLQKPARLVAPNEANLQFYAERFETYKEVAQCLG